jgi:F-type H+-transporting ATPase subunit b
MEQEIWYRSHEFWVAVSFVIFLGVFLRYAWPAIAKTLDARATRIKDQLEQAARLKAEAEQLLAGYERQKQDARKEAESILANAKQEAAQIRARAAEELEASLARRAQQAEEKIARAQTEATGHVRAQIIDMAAQAAREVIATRLAEQKDDPAIGRAIAAIGRQIG